MSELVVTTFEKDKYRASDVLRDLRRVDAAWTIDLEHAVAMYRNYNGSLHVEYDSGLSAGAGAAWGGLWGCFIGAMVAIPFTAGTSAVAAAATLAVGALIGFGCGAGAGAIDASWSREDVYADGSFIGQLGVPLQRGDSAILTVVRWSYPGVLAEWLMKYGGTVRRSSLTSAQAARLEGHMRERWAA